MLLIKFPNKIMTWLSVIAFTIEFSAFLYYHNTHLINQVFLYFLMIFTFIIMYLAYIGQEIEEVKKWLKNQIEY